MDNLLGAWKEFLKGKRGKKDVQDFQYRLADNIIELRNDLVNRTYQHGGYHAFKISDPKPRDIHKATVRDRLLHHAIYRKLYPIFDSTFIFDSYSCRRHKGTHRALNRFREFFRIVDKNDTKSVWVLKCDIRKFFASIDQSVLLKELCKYISDEDTINLIREVVCSFDSGTKGRGLPLGNLTSQLLVNMYMNRFDHFMKKEIKARYYIRYADDFIIMNNDREWLQETLPKIQFFLKETLLLDLHPKKIVIETVASGIDFLGWVHFPDHRVLRTVTKKRMLRNLKSKREGNKDVYNASLQSYLGMISHGNSKKLKDRVVTSS